MPFRVGPATRDKDKERSYKEREKKISSSRSFFGMGFPPSPKARSSSAGVLNEKKDIERNGTVIRSSAPGGAGMAWLQRPQGKSHGAARDRETKGHGWAVFPVSDTRDLLEARAGEPTTRSSSATSSADVRPHSDEPLGNKKETFLRRAASTGAGYGSFVKQKLDFRRPEATQQLTKEHAEPKSPERGWARNAIQYSKGLFHSNSTSTAVKRRDSESITEADRSFSFSSAKSVLAVYAPSRTSSGANEAPSVAEIDEPGNPTPGGGLQRGRAFKAGWQVDGQDGSKALARRSNYVPRDSVLGMFEGNIGGKAHTEERKSAQWKPPVLCLETIVVPQRDKIPVAFPDSEGRGRRVWVSVEFEGKVHFNGDKPLGAGVGLDVGVLMDLS